MGNLTEIAADVILDIYLLIDDEYHSALLHKSLTGLLHTIPQKNTISLAV